MITIVMYSFSTPAKKNMLQVATTVFGSSGMCVKAIQVIFSFPMFEKGHYGLDLVKIVTVFSFTFLCTQKVLFRSELGFA